MKTISTFLLLFVVAASFGQSSWTLDPAHTKIGFTVRHMAVSEVEGSFNQFEGAIDAKSDDFNGATITFTAKTASVDTDNERRDGHLKSPDFFEVEKYPEITFKGTLTKNGAAYVLKGDFTMHGVTKPVSFDVTYGGTVDTGRGKKAGFKVTGKINRHDYGLTWSNKTPGGELVVSDDVEITCKIEADKKA